jgi:hypothetical protein
MKLKNLPFLAPVLALGVLVAPGSAFGQDTRSDVEIWAQTCSNCHSNVPRTQYTPERWGSIMIHMQLNARLTDAQAEAIHRYILRAANRRQSTAQAAAGTPVVPTTEKAKPEAKPDKDPPKSGGSGG